MTSTHSLYSDCIWMCFMSVCYECVLWMCVCTCGLKTLGPHTTPWQPSLRAETDHTLNEEADCFKCILWYHSQVASALHVDAHPVQRIHANQPIRPSMAGSYRRSLSKLHLITLRLHPIYPQVWPNRTNCPESTLLSQMSCSISVIVRMWEIFE